MKKFFPDLTPPSSVTLMYYEGLDIDSGDRFTDSTIASVIFCDDETPPPTPTPDPGVIPEPGTGILLILGIFGLLHDLEGYLKNFLKSDVLTHP